MTTYTIVEETKDRLLEALTDLYNAVYANGRDDDPVCRSAADAADALREYVNAAHIVHCVNVHETLVEALEAAWATWRPLTFRSDEDERVDDIVARALALAKEGKK